MTDTNHRRTSTTDEHSPPPGAAGAGMGSAARLDFDLDPSIRTVLDGAWWPRSRRTMTELADLVIALDARQVRVGLIMLNPEGWQGHPRRLEVAGRTVRVAWFADLDPAVLVATTDTHRRIDLLVSIVDTTHASALAALMAPEDDTDPRSTEAILAALPHETEKPAQPGSAQRQHSQREGLTVADKSNHKSDTKKQGKTLKEKRAAKKAKTAKKTPSLIPPTDR